MAGDDLQKEARERLKDARERKQVIALDLREGYFFTAPQRAREVRSEQAPSNKGRETDAPELQISLGMEIAQDFATEILNTYTPEVIEWAQQKPGVDMDEQTWEDVSEQVERQTTAIMDAMKASHLYASLSLAYLPDVSLGTVGVFIEDKRASQPLSVQPVPIREIDVNIGPDGMIDDRFITRHTRWRHVETLLGKIRLPDEMREKMRSRPNGQCRVTWGWWRLWDKDADVFWQSVVLVNDELVSDAELQGEGSCPFLVGRFGADVMFPWGHGPTLQALPDLRRLDEVEALKVERFDFMVHPPFVYADDSVLNFSNGIEPGMGYAARPWANRRPFEPLVFESNLSFAEFETQKVEQRVRRLHFVDFPEQIGKTPPTAEQWLDELARTKKRIGTPGKNFFRELPAEIFLRFKYLLEKRGKIMPVKVNGSVLSLVPYDPTEQAQEHAEVQVAGRVLQMAATFFPQTMPVEIDAGKTIAAIKEKLRDKLVVIRDAAEVATAVEQFGGMLGGGGSPVEGGA